MIIIQHTIYLHISRLLHTLYDCTLRDVYVYTKTDTRMFVIICNKITTTTKQCSFELEKTTIRYDDEEKNIIWKKTQKKINKRDIIMIVCCCCSLLFYLFIFILFYYTFCISHTYFLDYILLKQYMRKNTNSIFACP